MRQASEHVSLKSNLLAEKLSYDFRMTRDRVERKRETETENSADEKGAEDHFFFPVHFPCWADEKVNRSANEHDAAEQMSPAKNLHDCVTKLNRNSEEKNSPNISCLRV